MTLEEEEEEGLIGEGTCLDDGKNPRDFGEEESRVSPHPLSIYIQNYWIYQRIYRNKERERENEDGWGWIELKSFLQEQWRRGYKKEGIWEVGEDEIKWGLDLWRHVVRQGVRNVYKYV